MKREGERKELIFGVGVKVEGNEFGMSFCEMEKGEVAWPTLVMGEG